MFLKWIFAFIYRAFFIHFVYFMCKQLAYNNAQSFYNNVIYLISNWFNLYAILRSFEKIY